MGTQSKPKKEMSEEDKKKQVQAIVEIGLRIMPKFKKEPNPHKK
jgi:hypothetical protein